MNIHLRKFSKDVKIGAKLRSFPKLTKYYGEKVRKCKEVKEVREVKEVKEVKDVEVVLESEKILKSLFNVKNH